MTSVLLSDKAADGSWIPRMIRRSGLSLLWTACAIAFLVGCTSHEKPDTTGTIASPGVYSNYPLGITVVLDKDWHFAEKLIGRHANATDPKTKSKCTGPLCEDADADVDLVIRDRFAPAAGLSLLGYKLSLLDRMRYPINRMAELMTLGSLSRSGLVPVGSLSQGQRGNKTAFRLLLRQKDTSQPSEVCYVVESNGYTVLLVGIVADTSELPRLQTIIENIKLDGQT